MKKLILFAIVVAAIGSAYFLILRSREAEGRYDWFAQCLAEKEVTMYGAAWCAHCQNEKKLFGKSFKYVPYVECPDDPKLCIEKGVTGYPTWIFPDGKKLAGEQGLEKLAAESQCQLEFP